MTNPRLEAKKDEPPQASQESDLHEGASELIPASPDPADEGLNAVDQAIAESFPASDPPSFMGGPAS